MKLCSVCKLHPRGKSNHSYCNLCHARKTREWRKTHNLTTEQKRKDSCRSYAYVYLKRGKITRKNCQICGEYAEMHHPDYSKPLYIIWLCRKHHMELHKTTVAYPPL